MKDHHRRRRLPHLFRDRKGATAIEYGLILSLIFLALMSGVTVLGGSVRERWEAVANSVALAGSQ